jgi:hypothetical protein
VNKMKKLLTGLISIVLLVSLLSLAASYGFKQTAANQTKVTVWLEQTSLYNDYINEITTKATSALSSGNTESSLLTPLIQQVAKSSLTENEFNGYLKGAVASNYAWLNGQTAKPSFKIDLTSTEQGFDSQISTALESELNSLPSCTISQELTLNPDASPLSLSCRPLDIKLSSLANQLSNEVSRSDAFLKNPVITAATINAYNDNTGKPYYVTYSHTPKYFRVLKNLTYISAGLIVICSLLIIVVAKQRKKGIRTIGYIAILSGAFLVVTSLASREIIKHVNIVINKDSSLAYIKPAAVDFSDKLARAFIDIGFKFGIIYLILGFILVITGLKLRKKTSKRSHQGKKNKKTKNGHFQPGSNDDYLSSIQLSRSELDNPLNTTNSSTSNRPGDNMRTAPNLKKRPRKNNKLIQ